MAYISYNKALESEFDGIVSKRDRLQGLKIIQLNFEEHDTCKEDGKIWTNFKAVKEDALNNGYPGSKVPKLEGQASYFEKTYNEYILQYNKESVEEFLIRRAVKTTIQILFDKGLFDNYTNADKSSEDFLFTTRHRSDLSKVNDGIQ